MKKLLIVSLLLNSFVIQAMRVTLPEAAVLETRLANKGFEHFLEKTTLIQKLNKKELYPLGVVTTVGFALYDYAKYMKNPLIAHTMESQKGDIVKIILQDCPAAIAELEEKGILEKD